MNDADSKKLEELKNKIHLRDELFIDNLEDWQFIVSRITEQDREIIEARRDIEEKYNKLLMEVVSKVPGETRHETAQRYIRERETLPSSQGSQGLKETGV